MSTIESQLSGMVLTVQDDEHNKVVQMPFTNRPSQLWDVSFYQNKMVLLSNERRDFCLSVDNDKLYLQKRDKSDDGQLFCFEKESLLNQNKAIDVPWGSKEDGVHIGAYRLHGGPNQLWNITTVEHHRSDGDKIADGNDTKDDDHDSETARPATSCHVWWRANDMEHTGHDAFEIKCTAKVTESTGETYFALICYNGGQSGGYGGIQEDKKGRKLFVFSVWDSPLAKVKSIGQDHHADCIIRPFGGEGNGMQCLLYHNWEIGSSVTQTIKFKRQSVVDGRQTWHISCDFDVQGNSIRMATYEWVGGDHVLNAPCFYSFIEDWNRQPRATGHLTCRAAEFYGAAFTSTSTGIEYTAKQESFTTSKGELDLFATNKVRQSCTCIVRNCVTMSTGGSE